VRRLKPELTFSILLNPFYGLQKRIEGAGLLTIHSALRLSQVDWNISVTSIGHMWCSQWDHQLV
jgi:hypothetical protein